MIMGLSIQMLGSFSQSIWVSNTSRVKFGPSVTPLAIGPLKVMPTSNHRRRTVDGGGNCRII